MSRGRGRTFGKRREPRAAGTQFLEGNRRLAAGDLAAAEAHFRRAIQLDPGLTEAHTNLGVALELKGVPEEAAACYRRALALEPGHLKAALNLGVLCVNGKRFEEARALYDQALDRFPGSAALWSNLGVLHTCEQRYESAERCFRAALELDPAYAKARFNLSYLLLREGRFEEGWSALEARAWALELEARIPAPRWQGESLTGKALLIGSEGGFGDMIQFCRYVPLLKDLGAARIGIVCRPALKRLLESLPGVDVVVAMGQPVPEGWDFWTLPLSLPGRCGTRFESIPAAIPYLQAPPELALKWRALLPPGGIRVGLAWRGNPQFENDEDRSLPGPDLLAPLLAVGGVHFISLQKDGTSGLPPGLAPQDAGTAVEDFADLAALIANLDLVISVDTAAAHLAGALGKRCWVLLPHYKTDWRWFTDREDSPWYPGSMRLFRQRGPGGWGPVLAAVAAALDRFRRDGSSG